MVVVAAGLKSESLLFTPSEKVGRVAVVVTAGAAGVVVVVVVVVVELAVGSLKGESLYIYPPPSEKVVGGAAGVAGVPDFPKMFEVMLIESCGSAVAYIYYRITNIICPMQT